MSRLTRIGFEFGFLKRLASSVTKSTSGYVPIFGYKSDSLWRNPLLRERRNAQYHFMSFCLTPYYIGKSLQCIWVLSYNLVPMLQSEVYVPIIGWIDSMAPLAFLLMLHTVAITRLRSVKSYYPHGK